MKKLLLLISIAFLAISCEGPMGPQGEPGSNYKAYFFTITGNQWKLNGSPDDYGSNYSYRALFPQLTDYVFDEGSVVAYIDYDNGVQTPLPSTIHYGKPSGSQDYLWSETIDCEFASGDIEFFVTRSDFMTKDNRPRTITFKVVLFW